MTSILSRPLQICWLGAGLDACALYRMQIPHFNIPGSTFYVFYKPEWNLIAASDVVVVQRCFSKPQFDFIKNCKESLGMKIVMDLDDNMFNIPAFNPMGEFLMKCRDGFRSCMAEVDVISVSTKRLKREVEHNIKDIRRVLNIPVIVAENRIDTRLFASPMPNEEETIVGWAGSSSHVGDLKIMDEAITRLIAEEPAVTFEFRGLKPDARWLSAQNTRFKRWVPVGEYMRRWPTWGWSIALAPLTDHPFNTSKSGIKMIEAGWCKIPCLASYIEPYERFVSYDSELRWLLVPGRNQWYQKIRELIHDKARREYLGKRMYDVTMKHYTFDKPHEGWREVFEAL